MGKDIGSWGITAVCGTVQVMPASEKKIRRQWLVLLACAWAVVYPVSAFAYYNNSQCSDPACSSFVGRIFVSPADGGTYKILSLFGYGDWEMRYLHECNEIFDKNFQAQSMDRVLKRFGGDLWIIGGANYITLIGLYGGDCPYMVSQITFVVETFNGVPDLLIGNESTPNPDTGDPKCNGASDGDKK